MSDPEDNSNKESWFFDNDFNGLPDDIVFDDVLKFLDLPLEDVDPNGAEEDWSAQFQSLGEPCFDAFSVSSAGLRGESKIRNEIPQIGKSLSAPYNEIPLIKQVAKIAGPTYGKTIPNQNVPFSEKKDLHQYRSYSPVSVFEGSSTSSAENSSFDLPVIPVKRARSKRRRPSILNPVFSISFILPNSPALQKYHKTPASESDSNKVKKPRKRDLSVLSGDVETSSSQDSVVTRKCSHCEITKTPQWREGPKGPKTLCNACGVRYRSGRLYPEYRPAASPTFVESIHSNCHKKVMEMRCKVIKECVRAPSRLAT